MRNLLRGASGSAWPARIITATTAAGTAGAGAATGHPIIGLITAFALAAGHLLGIGAPTVAACWIAMHAAKNGAEPVKLIQELVKLAQIQR